MSIPRWAVLSMAVMLMAAGIALAVLHFAREEGNPFARIKPGVDRKAEIRALVGRPDAVEVLPRAECWSYGPHDGFTEAKVCFGERGRLAWFAYSRHRATMPEPPPPPALP